VTGLLFSDVNLVLNEFNWQQYFNDGNSALIIGRYDPNDYMDVSGYANPWTTFHNLASLLNTSIALPDTSWGAGFGHWFSNSPYLVGSVNDANGSLVETTPFKHGGEFFKQIGIGWTPERKLRYNKNFQITYWTVDEREHLGIPESDGIAINANWTFDNEWMLWTRLGWSDGLAPIYGETYSVGIAKKLESPIDILAFSVNWGDPAEPSLANQTTYEIIYKSKFAQNLILTPSIQYLKNPTLNPNEDAITIAGLRVQTSALIASRS
jgi:porin